LIALNIVYVTGKIRTCLRLNGVKLHWILFEC